MLLCCICSTALTNPYYCRSGDGVMVLCSNCHQDQMTTIQPCYYCLAPSNPEYHFTLPFINLDMMATVKLCSPECRTKEVLYARSLQEEESSFGLKYQCFTCGKIEEKMKRCQTCKWARYCSPDCQMADWGKHKTECRKQ